MDEEAIVGLVVACALFTFLSIWVLAAYAAYAWRSWHDAKVKRDMIARGYTAQEIIAVVRCKRSGKCDDRFPDVPPAKPIKQHPAYA